MNITPYISVAAIVPEEPERLDDITAAEAFLAHMYDRFWGRMANGEALYEAECYAKSMIRPESRYTMICTIEAACRENGYATTLMFNIVERTSHDHSGRVHPEDWPYAEARRSRTGKLPGGREDRTLGMRMVPKLR